MLDGGACRGAVDRVEDGEEGADELCVDLGLLLQVLEAAVALVSLGGLLGRLLARLGLLLALDGPGSAGFLVDLHHGVEVEDVGAGAGVEDALVFGVGVGGLDEAGVVGCVWAPDVALVAPLPGDVVAVVGGGGERQDRVDGEDACRKRFRDM